LTKLKDALATPPRLNPELAKKFLEAFLSFTSFQVPSSLTLSAVSTQRA
jgi:hypothetical protein